VSEDKRCRRNMGRRATNSSRSDRKKQRPVERRAAQDHCPSIGVFGGSGVPRSQGLLSVHFGQIFGYFDRVCFVIPWESSWWSRPVDAVVGGSAVGCPGLRVSRRRTRQSNIRSAFAKLVPHTDELARALRPNPSGDELDGNRDAEERTRVLSAAANSTSSFWSVTYESGVPAWR
jgi:hypothetical protein